MYSFCMPLLFDAIREGISRAEAEGTTRYQISKDTGISQAALSRFVNGSRGLSVEMVERLAHYLKLEIVVRPKKIRKDR